MVRTSKRWLSILLAVVMILTMLPTAIFAAEPAQAVQITTLEQLTTGQYALLVDTGYAMGEFSSGWITADAAEPASARAWTLTVDGANVKLTDANGVTVAPKGANNNGIVSGDYSWNVTCENGLFRFHGQGVDTVTLASNKSAENKFRAYKNATIAGQAGGYPCDFAVYKLDGAPVDPPVDPEEPETVDIAKALAGADGTEFTVKGVVTLVDGNNLYLQDATGGICLRTTAKPEDVQLGDTVIGTGVRAEYRAMAQLGSGTYEKSSGLTLKAKKTAIADLTEADVCTYVQLTKLTVTEVYDKDGTYALPNLTLQDENGDTIQIYKAVVNKTDGVNWDVKVGDVLDVKAAVGTNNGTLQLRTTVADEITAHVDGPLVDGGKVVIYNPASGMALSSDAIGTYYRAGVSVTPNGDGTISNPDAALVWDVTDNGDGTYTFSHNGDKLSMNADRNSLPLNEVNDTWTVAEAATAGCSYLINANRPEFYVEWFEKYTEFSTYQFNASNEGIYAVQFLTVSDSQEIPGGLPQTGDTVVIYNLSAKGVLAGQNDTLSILNAEADLTDGLTVANGGRVFTVEQNGEYYRFVTEYDGYLCSNGTGNNAFYSKEVTEDADWTLTEYNGGYSMESRTAKFNGKYSQFMEYYADSYKTYSMNKVTDKDIFTFKFLPYTGETTQGVVNVPAVDFGTPADAFVDADYVLTFTVDAVFGVKNMTVTVNGVAVEAVLADGVYTVTVPANHVAGEKLTVVVSGTDAADVAFAGSVDIAVKDEPVISGVKPAAGYQTGEDKRPEISAVLSNVGENPTITMTVNGETVEAVYVDGKVSYTAAEDMADGRVEVRLTVKRADGKETSKTWSFTIGKTMYQRYYGQLHSHTQYSDGSGTLETALDYIKNLPESANVDFTAFTDHSNYFDSTSAANPEDALYDMTKATADSQKLWSAYKGSAAEFNRANAGEKVALAGFEMTWSGGPGHMNTFNTPGIVSRNNKTLNNKTGDAGMQAYYDLLSRPEGAASISQFNHPGKTFGNFSDFAYWNPVIDTRISLLEVGNGEGQIGAGGYFPSYEQYTMALDKGWHVAPTNNQDNHKGKWGNANDARDVILTDNFTEEGLYEAMQAMRMYATEDKNLELDYTVNGQMMGSSMAEVPETLDIQVTVSDPDRTDSISKVEVVVNSGKVAHTWNNPAELSAGLLTCQLAPDYSYYFIRVTEGDGDIAVTAPVWVGATLKLGISKVECTTSTPVTDEALTLNTTLFNSETTDATVKSLTFTNGDTVLGSITEPQTLPASGTLTVPFQYTPTAAKVMTISVTAVVEQNGKEFTFSQKITLDVLNAAKLVYIGIDASHYNEYVNGNYKDSMGNFSELAAGYSVRTVELHTSEELIAATQNDKYKMLILTAPSRRLADAQSDPKTYSEAELKAITDFNAKGGVVVLAGWSDNYENYPVIQDNPAIKHMAETQNEILEALGSSLRISDDATYDDVRSAADGVDPWRLYFSTYNFENPLTENVEFDAEHPYDRLYTEVFSHYGGASVYAVDENGKAASELPATVSPVVYGHSSTYSKDVDGDGLGGKDIPTYDGRLMIMASEQLDGKGLIVVSGAAFMSNFEVQATIGDSNAEKNYANYNICENLVQMINPMDITDISDVQAETEEGIKFTIEGVVTSNASGYDKDTAFFDCIYLQDGTAGINAFPVAGSYKIGDKVRITGTTSSYQGERQIAVETITLLSEGNEVTAKTITAEELNNGSVLGSLVTLTGKVQSFALENGLVQTILVEDEAGNVGRVFIDGYITTAEDVKDLEVGCNITVTGLASYDNTFNAPDGPFPRIRIRDRADVVCTASGGETENVDKSKLQALYELDKAMLEKLDQKDYTKDSWNRFQAAMEQAETVLNDPDATQAEVDEALDTLRNAKLVKKDKHPGWRPNRPMVPGVGLPFGDVDKGDWFYDDVKFVYDQGIMDGTSDGRFAPEEELTRGMIVTILYRMENEPSVRFTGAFADVKDGLWYSDAVEWAAREEIVNGYSNGSYGPNDPVTREQLSAILYRYAKFVGVDVETDRDDLKGFRDAAAVSDYAEDAMNWAVGAGLMNGSNGKLMPQAQASRAQVAAIIHRFLEEF